MHALRARLAARPRLAAGAAALVVAAAVLLGYVVGDRAHEPAQQPQQTQQTQTPRQTPQGQPQSGIKAQIAGLIDRNGPPEPAYQRAVRGFVVNADWSDLQPTQEPGTAHGGPLSDHDPAGADGNHDGNAIDRALATVRRLNAADPALHMQLKLRLFAGTRAPEWAKNLDGAPARICQSDRTASDGQGTCGTIGRFWTPQFATAYDDLQRKLAQRYDDAPELLETNISRCTGIFAEPFIRMAGVPANRDAYRGAGYTVDADKACQREQIDIHAAVWQHTRSALDLFPYQVVDTSVSPPAATTDEGYTESMMSYCRQVLGPRCVLGNNGAADGPGGGAEARMNAAIKALGAPIYYQTQTAAKTRSLPATLDWIASQTGAMAELPAGYDNPGKPTVYLPPEQLESFAQRLRDNAVRAQ